MSRSAERHVDHLLRIREELSMQVSMDWTFTLVLLVLFQPSVSGLFTVEAEKSSYEAEFGGDVVMGCRFEPTPRNSLDLKVTWHWIASDSAREVYRRDKGREILESQHADFQGRAKLLSEQLDNGFSKLQVSGLRINDSGTYQCLVQTSEGADYKSITLSVKAPYKPVTTHIKKTAADGEMLLLTCQSEGYPKSSVEWQDGHLQQINSSTMAVPMPDQRFTVTSEILVRASDKNNYTCRFKIGGLSEMFHIPEDMPVPQGKNDAVIIVSLGVILVAIIAIVIMYRRRKGFRGSTRNALLGGRGITDSLACSQHVKKEIEEEATAFNDASTEENLKACVKALYSNLYCAEDVRCHLDGLCLQNKLGEPENIQALLPQAGETLFLHGATGNGTSLAAHVLVSSWMRGPTRPGPDVLDLSAVRLLLCVDCSKARADLFQEIMTQLNLREKISAEAELRTMLSTSEGDLLLLLDGYREENQLFDESLKKFLNERRGCRVLVTTCLGHSFTLMDTVGGVRELHIQAVKS